MLLNENASPVGGGLAVWQIVEDEATLLAILRDMLKPDVYAALLSGLTSLHNPTRRGEWLAVRALVAHCLGGDKVIAYESSGCPYLTDHSCEISISHTKGYAALVWHPTQAVGVDIERRTDRVMRVVKKYVNEAEQTALKGSSFHSPDGELLLWTAKEALYKVARIRLLDCLYDLTVAIPLSADSHNTTAWCEANQTMYALSFVFSSDYVLSQCWPMT